MDIVWVLAGLAATIVLVAVFVALRLARNNAPTTRTTTTPPQHVLDPELLAVLETLPENQAKLLKRMLHSHAHLERNSATPIGTAMAATNVVQQAVPLAQESARLESYLARYDLERVVRSAATDPTARPLAEDLMRMADRGDQLLETLEDAAQQLGLDPAPNPEVFTALADKLKLF